MILHLYEYFLDVKDACLCFCYLTLPALELQFILLSILFLFEVIGPAGNGYCEPTFADLRCVMLLSQISHVSFHSIVLLFEIGILAHNLILHSLGPHSVDSGFFDDWVVNFLGDLEALADTCTVFENHIDIVLHGIKIAKVHIEVIKKVGCVTEHVLTNWRDHMIINDSLSAHIVSHVAELGFFHQRQLLFFYHKAVVHVADELH